MKKEYVLKYQVSPFQKVEFHQSYVSVLKDFSQPIILEELKKHGYSFGEYIVSIQMNLTELNPSEKKYFVPGIPISFYISVLCNGEIGTIILDSDADNIFYRDNAIWPLVDPMEDVSSCDLKLKVYKVSFSHSEKD